MVPPPPAISKLRMHPTVSLLRPSSMWLREKRGCQSGRPLKSRILPQTFSTGASITALTNTFVISISCQQTKRPRPVSPLTLTLSRKGRGGFFNGQLYRDLEKVLHQGVGEQRIVDVERHTH